ncbi:MAG: TIGR00282 family metallophosphoesterase [Desulfotomaculaceae bacterium]|nr:TIGR00282 family metallophosphoesterase [Desulfotomaculaceae bacterium]
MRLLMIGDVVGRPGRRAVKVNLRGLIREFNLQLIIANGENAAGGSGITREVAQELFDTGVDILTMGNHVWNKKEAVDYLARETRIVRPGNYPPGTPGAGAIIYKTKQNIKVAVLNLAGRVFMQALDCPFRKADELIEQVREQAKVIIVDFHAEATSEKMAMGWYLAGRVAAVCGTHTHVQTADERILPGGTAFITDLGMTGPCDSVIGAKKEIAMERFITQLPLRYEAANGLFQFNGVIIDIDEETGEATAIRRIQNYE